MSEERFNAVPNASTFNCPICFRAKSLVQNRRDKSLFTCSGWTDRSGGCFTRFRLQPANGAEYATLVRIREPREVQPVSIEDLARIRGGSL